MADNELERKVPDSTLFRMTHTIHRSGESAVEVYLLHPAYRGGSYGLTWYGVFNPDVPNHFPSTDEVLEWLDVLHKAGRIAKPKIPRGPKKLYYVHTGKGTHKPVWVCDRLAIMNALETVLSHPFDSVAVPDAFFEAPVKRPIKSQRRAMYKLLEFLNSNAMLDELLLGKRYPAFEAGS